MSTDKLPGNDAELKEALKKLFAEWRRAIKDKDLKGKFIVDGALPGYYRRKPKILYLAREMHTTTTKSHPNKYIKDNPEKRNIVDFVDAFLSGRRDSRNSSSEAHAVYTLTTGKNKNILPCWRLAARIAYCVCQGGKIGLSGKLSPEELQKKLKELWKKPSFEELQSAYNNKKKEFSFAILEVSKYNNIVKSPKAPGISSVFEQYAYKSLGFIRREIDIINPDLIISWNLRGAFNKDKDGNKGNNGDCFLKELTGSDSFKEPSKNVRIWMYKGSKKKEIPLLDTWHFSVDDRIKNRQKELFNPVMRAVQKLIAEGKLKERKG